MQWNDPRLGNGWGNLWQTTEVTKVMCVSWPWTRWYITQICMYLFIYIYTLLLLLFLLLLLLLFWYCTVLYYIILYCIISYITLYYIIYNIVIHILYIYIFIYSFISTSICRCRLLVNRNSCIQPWHLGWPDQPLGEFQKKKVKMSTLKHWFGHSKSTIEYSI